MRILGLAVLILFVLPPLAAAAEPVTAELDVLIGADRSEALTLTFGNLRERTEYRSICLPARATVSDVRDAEGPVTHQTATDNGRVVLTFTARTPSVTITMTRPAASDEGGPLSVDTVNFCTPSGSRTHVTVRADAPHEVFFASRGGAVASGVAQWRSDGPIAVTYSYESPLPTGSGIARLDVGPFRFFLPEGAEAEVREMAELAAPAIAAAMREAGVSSPWDRLRVSFVARDEFPWESGHYGGDGIIAVKPDTLVRDAREGFPYVGAKVLVHEAFHAVTTPTGKGDVEEPLSWWLEGTARHAERRVDAAAPDSRKHCEASGLQTQCWFFDDRISRNGLAQAYGSDFTFQTRWEPSLPQDDDTRRFYYALSEYIVDSYIARQGEGVYRTVWADVHAAFEGKTCPCPDGWLEETLLANAPNMTRDELYRPYGALWTNDPAAFDAMVGHRVQAPAVVEAAPLFGIPFPATLGVLAVAVVALIRRRG